MVAAVRLRKLEDEYEGSLQLEWRSFLLRPQPASPPRTLEQFRGYTESWRRCAAEEPDAGFRVWSSEEGPPTHSVPPHIVAKAAASLGVQEGARMRDLLFRSYFVENRDITSEENLLELWLRAGLPESEVASWQRPEWLEQIVAEHREAVEHGTSGVPAVRLAPIGSAEGHGVLMGAQPLEVYRAWIEKAS